MKKQCFIAAALAAFTWLGASANAQTAAYFANSSTPYGAAANNAGLNIGQSFTVAGTNIQVLSLGVYDYAGDGLKAAHDVILFSNETAIASVTVPAGTSASLKNGFRYMPLASPMILSAGTYAVVAYQMNGTANNSDGYGDTGNPACNGFNGTFNLLHTQTIFEFSSSANAYPGTGGGSLGTASANLAGASFLYADFSPVTIAYTADPAMAKFGGAANNDGLNIGHKFTVKGQGITIFDLGVFDYQADGLAAAHNVTLFTNDVPLANVNVPAGTTAPLGNGFRFAPLDAPITLPAGNYSIIVYQLNGRTTSDPYCEENVSGFNGSASLENHGYSPYVFNSNDTPDYPSGGDQKNFAVCSFTYSNVMSAPLIAEQSPTNVTVFAGTTPAFKVTASAIPSVFTYQWYLNGTTAIEGATNATYSPGQVAIADSGKTFSCKVANIVGSTNTHLMKLKVVTAPAQLYPSTVMADRPLSYWRMDETPDDGAGNNGVICNDYIGGAGGIYTSTMLALPGALSNDSNKAADFGSIAITDSFVGNIPGVDFATSTTAAFSIEAWVNGTMASYDGGIVTKGSPEQFCLDTGGSGHAFRFFVRDASGSARVAAGTNVLDGGWHHLVGVCDQANGAVLLYVDGLLSASNSIGTHAGIKSSSAPVSIGSRPSSSSSGYDYQFFGSIDEVAVYGSALSVTQVVSHYYAAGVAPRIVQSPTNSTVSEGASATFTAVAMGTGPLAYQWYDVTSGIPGTPLARATNSALVLNGASSSQNGTYYQVVVTNAFGSVTSEYAQLTVVAGPPVIQVDVPAQTIAYAGRSATISVDAGGTLPLQYQWKLNGVALSDGPQVIGSRTNVLTLLNVQASQSGATYQVEISNSQGGPVSSTVGTLQVIKVPSFASEGLGWQLNGTPSPATFAQNVLTLTDGGGSEAKSAYFAFPLYVGGFQASFTYQDVTINGADGAAFVMQNSPAGTAAVGGAGGGLGFSGVTPSAAVLFNIYQSPGIGFGTNGTRSGDYGGTSPVNIANGNPIGVKLTYAEPNLQVELTDQVTQDTFSTNLVVGSLPALVGGETAYVGFSGADGASVSTQTISDFSFKPLPPLNIQAAGAGALVISWPASVGGYSVQYRTDLTTGSWQPLTGAVSQVDGKNQVTISQPGQQVFYRLVMTTE
jgi:hypothetical protein